MSFRYANPGKMGQLRPTPAQDPNKAVTRYILVLEESDSTKNLNYRQRPYQ